MIRKTSSITTRTSDRNVDLTTQGDLLREMLMTQSMKHVHRGFGSVRPYLCGPTSLIQFIQDAFGAEILEVNEGGPTLLKLGDSLIWVEAGELPAHIQAWVGSVYAYVQDVDSVYARAIELGARSIAVPED